MHQYTRSAFIRQMIENEDRISASSEFSYKAHIRSRQDYDALYRRSIEDPDGFWGEAADEHLDWFKHWDTSLRRGSGGTAHLGGCGGQQPPCPNATTPFMP